MDTDITNAGQKRETQAFDPLQTGCFFLAHAPVVVAFVVASSLSRARDSDAFAQ